MERTALPERFEALEKVLYSAVCSQMFITNLYQGPDTETIRSLDGFSEALHETKKGEKQTTICFSCFCFQQR